MVDNVNDWVNKWRDDLINNRNIQESVGMSYELLKVCNYTRKAHGVIVEKIVKPDRFKSIFDETSAYILYNWEAMVVHSRSSLILALSALYNSASTLLRDMLELLVKGAFYECLAHGKFRKQWILKSGCPADRLRKELISKIEACEEARTILEKDSSYIFELLSEPLYKIRLRFQNLVKQLVHWGLLYPLRSDEAFKVINDVYQELCLNVHQYPSKTDSGRAVTEKGELFEQKVLKKSLRQFLRLWVHVIDIATLMSVNIFKAKRNRNELKAISSEIVKTEEFRRAEIPLTKRLTNTLMSA